MGGRRKTKTFTKQEKSLPPWTVNGSVTARNLGKSALAGVIFGCKHDTMQECLSRQLFGLPAHHFSYIRYIDLGMPLFLFNYSDRTLHGIFEATSQGSLNINPHAWTSNGMDYTPYAAQVKIQTRMQCHPLVEHQFKPIISKNYFEERLFWFELDQRQTNKLIAMLSSLPVSATVFSSRRSSSLPKGLQTTNVGEGSIHVEGLALQINATSLEPKKKWSSLFKVSTTDSIEGGEDFKKPASETNISSSKHSNYERESYCTSHSSEEESKSYEAPTDGWGINGWGINIGEPVAFKSRNEVHSSSYVDISVEGEEYNSMALEVNLPSSSDRNWDSLSASHQSSETSEVLENLDLKGATENTEEDVHFKTAEENLLEDYYGEDTKSQWRQVENNSPIGANTDLDLKSSNCQLIAQLMAEIKELKLSHQEQVQKINLLEQELGSSKIEIQSFKSQYEMLDCRMSSMNSNIEGKRPQSTKVANANLDDSVLVVGGFDGSSWLSSLNCYHPSKDVMESLPAMSSVRSHASTAKLNGEVYVFGGVHGNLWYDTVESYNPTNHQWVSRPPLKKKRASLAGVSLNNKIFAIGGGNGVESFSEVEMFDLGSGRWFQTPSMRNERFSLAASELDGILYAVGGFNGKSYLNSAEMFDPRENSWREIASMSSKRGCHCLAVLNKKLYAVGGYNGYDMTSTVEVYDPCHGSWTISEPMNESKGYSATAVIGNAIYAFGGLKNNNVMSERVECYKEDRGWEVTNLRAFGKRCFFSAVVLQGQVEGDMGIV